MVKICSIRIDNQTKVAALESNYQQFGHQQHSPVGSQAVAQFKAAVTELQATQSWATFQPAAQAFQQAAHQLNHWIRRQWYQFGGRPANMASHRWQAQGTFKL